MTLLPPLPLATLEAADAARAADRVAERLLAHARLCRHIAQACWNEETAAALDRLADDCTTAARLAAFPPARCL